jgi:hypothetical protein
MYRPFLVPTGLFINYFTVVSLDFVLKSCEWSLTFEAAHFSHSLNSLRGLMNDDITLLCS